MYFSFKMELPIELNERFIRHSARPMVLLLAFFGLDLRNSSHQSRFKQIIKVTWCLFWLIFHILSTSYISHLRIIRRLVALFQSSTAEDPDNIIHFIYRLTPVTFGGPFVHLFLIMTFRRTIQSILEDLEILDLKLGRPRLLNIRYWSTIAFQWISVVFLIRLSYSVYWDLYHPVRIVFALEMASNLMAIAAQVYAIAAVWMFVLCSQLFVGIYKEIALQLESGSTSGMEEKMGFLLDSHQQLVGAVNRVMDRFGWILMANTCFMALNLFYTLYYAIEFFYDGYWFTGLFHSLDLLIAFFRLWLGCYSADLILNKAKIIWIPILRRLRDNPSKTIPLSQRAKITHFITEVTRSAQRPLKLLGVVPLSKSLLLPLVQNTLAFVVIVYQFKSVGNRYTRLPTTKS